MHVIKKRNNIFAAVTSVSLMLSGITAIVTPIPTHALSLEITLPKVQITDSNDKKEEPVESVGINPGEVLPAQPIISPVESVLSPIVSPIVDTMQPGVPAPLPIQTPISIPTMPVVTNPINPIITPQLPITTQPSATSTPAASPPAPEVNLQKSPTVPNVASKDTAETETITLARQDTTLQPSQVTGIQSNEGSLFAKYMSSKIGSRERNQLYVFGAIIAFIGGILYYLSTRPLKRFAFTSKNS